jgi:hypothetical protein
MAVSKSFVGIFVALFRMPWTAMMRLPRTKK